MPVKKKEVFTELRLPVIFMGMRIFIDTRHERNIMKFVKVHKNISKQEF